MDIDNILDEIPSVDEPKEQPKQENTQKREFKDPYYTTLSVDLESISRNSKTFMVASANVVPDEIKDKLRGLLMELAEKRYVYRTSANDRDILDAMIYPTYTFKEIYLPWKNFNKLVTGTLNKPTEAAFRKAIYIMQNTRKEFTAEKFNNLPSVVKLFEAVKLHLLLGKNLDTATDFVIIYTKCGSTRFTKDTDYETGGNALNILGIANFLNIKVINLGNENAINEIKTLIA